MIITLDTEAPALQELIAQTITGRIQQHYTRAREGKLQSDTNFVDSLSKKLVETLLSYAMIEQRVLSAEDVTYYTNSLITWIASTLKSQDPKSIEAIRSLWDDEPWDSIQAKLSTEASTWHVWWMDGVRKYIAIDRGWIGSKTTAAAETINESLRE